MEKEKLGLPESRIVDIYIVFVKNERQAVKVQKKMSKMGFKSGLKWNDKINCYYVARQVHSKDRFNGNKFIQWGRGEIETESPEFEKVLFKYKKFINL